MPRRRLSRPPLSPARKFRRTSVECSPSFRSSPGALLLWCPPRFPEHFHARTSAALALRFGCHDGSNGALVPGSEPSQRIR